MNNTVKIPSQLAKEGTPVSIRAKGKIINDNGKLKIVLTDKIQVHVDPADPDFGVDINSVFRGGNKLNITRKSMDKEKRRSTRRKYH